MNADIQLSDTFPHGTTAGYLQGCHGSHCPAVMVCRDVHRRYVGDFSFKRRFDAGVPLVQIMAQDAEEAAQEALKAREATRVKRARKRRSQGNTTNLKPAERLIPETVLRQNLADGLTDQQIADLHQLERPQVTNMRSYLHLPCNPARRSGAEAIALVRTVAHLSNEEAATELGLSIEYIRKRRRDIRIEDAA